ncbi:MAG: hypothetical protein K2X07_03775 [Caulobacteraceae bacterium]|nr:hypothetical protein [Caulobacteraceae bacterium]
MTHPDDLPTYITGSDVWDVARQMFEAGYSARIICEDLELSTATFWRRAREEGWLRRDQRRAAPPPPPLDMDAPVQDPADAADIAWRRMTQALEAGHVLEAMRWRRLHAGLAVGEAHAASRAQKAAREQIDGLSPTARLIEAQAKAALQLRDVERG